MNKIFVAFDTKTAKNWQELATPPKAPGNYKDQAKIDEYVSKAWADLTQAAKDEVLTGELNTVLYGTDVAHFKPATSVLDSIAGFNICYVMRPTLFLRMSIAAAIVLQGKLSNAQSWALRNDISGQPLLGELQGGPKLIDPVRVLLGTNTYEEGDLPRVAARFKLPPLTGDVSSRLTFTRAAAELLG